MDVSLILDVGFSLHTTSTAISSEKATLEQVLASTPLMSNNLKTTLSTWLTMQFKKTPLNTIDSKTEIRWALPISKNILKLITINKEISLKK